MMKRDLCKTPPFDQSRRQTQISILGIFNILLWLKFSPSLILTKIEHFSKVSKIEYPTSLNIRESGDKEIEEDINPMEGSRV